MRGWGEALVRGITALEVSLVAGRGLGAIEIFSLSIILEINI